MHHEPIADTPRQRIRLGLETAASRLRTAALWSAANRAVDRIAVAAFVTGCALAAAQTAVRYYGHPPLSVGAVLTGAAVVVAAVGVATVWPAFRYRPTAESVAERLDLAAGDHNAIATALDLAASHDGSVLASAAIERGVAAIEQYRDVRPVTEIVALRHGRAWPLAAGGLGLLLISLGGPATQTATFATANAAPAVVLPSTGISETPRRPTVDRPAADRQNPPPGEQGSPLARPSAAAATPTDPRPTDSNASAAGNAAAGMPSGDTRARAAAGGASARPAAPAAAPQSSPAARPDRSAQTASPGPSAADGVASAGTAPRAAGSPGDASPGEKSGEKNGSSPSNGPSDNDNGPPPPGDQPGQSQGGKNGSDNPKAPDAAGSGNGRSSQSSDSGGGNGQSSGQSPPKKARGVAPLLLGSRQPDLLQGRQLPGPDERTPLRLPPVRRPGEPDATAGTDGPTTPEPPTGVYRVPPDRRTAVDAYFRQFHRDASAPG